LESEDLVSWHRVQPLREGSPCLPRGYYVEPAHVHIDVREVAISVKIDLKEIVESLRTLPGASYDFFGLAISIY
jgi:hypothetical protein